MKNIIIITLFLASPFSLVLSDTPPLMEGLSWEAEDGLIEGDFVMEDTVIRHTTWALEDAPLDTSARGWASYRFQVKEPGDYIIKIYLKAEALSANSLIISIDDSTIIRPKMIFDFPVTKGTEARTVSWRGQGNEDNNEFSPKTFSLTRGEHTLFILGREGETVIDKITIEPVSKARHSPIVFTPDGDGEHDVLHIEESGNARIMNRNGVLIREFEAPGTWDGRDHDHRPAPSGAYLLQVDGEKPRVINLVR